MARIVLKKINTKLNFIWRRINCLNYLSRRLLCNALIQPHFDYRCTSLHPLLSMALKTKLQIVQNKCIRFWLELPPCGHKNPSHFRKIHWLPVERRAELSTSTTVFKYWKGIAPSYLNMFMPSLNNCNTRSQMALDIPIHRTIKGQKSIAFLRPKICNKVSSSIKTAATTSSFTHRLKNFVAIFFIFCIIITTINFFFIFLKVDCFFYFISSRSYL